MTRTITTTVLTGSIVGDDVQLTTVELCRACHASAQQIEVWVVEGVLQPSGGSRDEWRFGAAALRRLRTATRLARDLELDSGAVALALDLLERIDELEGRLRRLGAYEATHRE